MRVFLVFRDLIAALIRPIFRASILCRGGKPENTKYLLVQSLGGTLLSHRRRADYQSILLVTSLQPSIVKTFTGRSLQPSKVLVSIGIEAVGL